MTEQLAAALAAEEAAIYAYGVIGVHLKDGDEVSRARSAELEHRARRDGLVDRLDELKASTAPAPPAYRLPFEVSDREGALKLAVHVEDGVAQAWRALLPVTEGAERLDALSFLTDSAVRATRWRRIAEVTPLTMAFPGRPS
ncbi:ferritin-like domain-containing protein [Actinoplanes sp. NEAU-A12]|uniref:Ferritin-like domain-containing protein n=1 Tax=Actinoplanes sandaracinus TaxID=3045177 RepID=A0ABT6WD05_9ACTN|nr:ferritin-like domain-containing protein [Actinoplanes sandaracinus]MDI6097578.1 ferritin-like domain-containing protein [Actinoplanes sandaracinus]